MLLPVELELARLPEGLAADLTAQALVGQRMARQLLPAWERLVAARKSASKRPLRLVHSQMAVQVRLPLVGLAASLVAAPEEAQGRVQPRVLVVAGAGREGLAAVADPLAHWHRRIWNRLACAGPRRQLRTVRRATSCRQGRLQHVALPGRVLRHVQAPPGGLRRPGPLRQAHGLRRLGQHFRIPRCRIPCTAPRRGLRGRGRLRSLRPRRLRRLGARGRLRSPVVCHLQGLADELRLFGPLGLAHGPPPPWPHQGRRHGHGQACRRGAGALPTKVKLLA
mmetsp:Transcript_68906/g.217874  ORF Transcript_68906/g.217874 Transcript_68906/m.217874 type:complete len:280 (+) Transcript_68906:570-1409(+)